MWNMHDALMIELDMRGAPQGRQLQLSTLLEVAMERLANIGIDLDFNSNNDRYLVVDYAAWLYRRRNQSGSKKMPESLSHDIKDRLIGGKARNTDGA